MEVEILEGPETTTKHHSHIALELVFHPLLQVFTPIMFGSATILTTMTKVSKTIVNNNVLKFKHTIFS